MENYYSPTLVEFFVTFLLVFRGIAKVVLVQSSLYLTLNEPATTGRIVDRVEVKLDLTTDQ
jgi:hypothetical protein